MCSSTRSVNDLDLEVENQSLKKQVKSLRQILCEKIKKVATLENSVCKLRKNLEEIKKPNKSLTLLKFDEIRSQLKSSQYKNHQNEAIIESLTSYIRILHESDEMTKNQLLNRASELIKLSESSEK